MLPTCSIAQSISIIIDKAIGSIRKASSDHEKLQCVKASVTELGALRETVENRDCIDRAEETMRRLEECYQQAPAWMTRADQDLVGIGATTKEQIRASRGMRRQLAEDYALFTASITLFEAARKAEEASDYEGALLLYRMNIDRYVPTGIAYYERLSALLERLKRYDEAIEVLERALSAPGTTLANFKGTCDRSRGPQRSSSDRMGLSRIRRRFFAGWHVHDCHMHIPYRGCILHAEVEHMIAYHTKRT